MKIFPLNAFIACTCLLFLAACVSLPHRPAQIQKSPLRVGYVVRHASYPTHWNSQSYVNNYTQFEWNLTDPLKLSLENAINSDGGMLAVDLAFLGLEPQQLSSLISIHEGKWMVIDPHRVLIERLRTEFDIDYLVEIHPYHFSEVTHCTQFGCFGRLEGIGTGIKTTGFLGYYNFKIIQGLEFNAFDLHNYARISDYAPTNRPNEQFRVESFPTPVKWRDMNDQELQHIIPYLEQANENLAKRIVANIKGIDIRCREVPPKPGHPDYKYEPEKLCTKKPKL